MSRRNVADERKPSLWLTVDRGNSTLDCRLLGSGLNERARIEPTSRAFEDFLGARRPARVGALTVVADGLEIVARSCARLDLELLRAGSELSCPLDLDYAAELGADRWVAALAAHRRHQGRNCIVVDCGTAVTVDAVDATGRFRGGAIAPGARALATGLASRAPALPPARLDGDPEALPHCAVDAVSIGVQVGFAGLVEKLVAEIAAAAGLDGFEVVLTGGDAELLLRRSRHRYDLRPELIHDGLQCLLGTYDSRC